MTTTNFISDAYSPAHAREHARLSCLWHALHAQTTELTASIDRLYPRPKTTEGPFADMWAHVIDRDDPHVIARAAIRVATDAISEAIRDLSSRA